MGALLDGATKGLKVEGALAGGGGARVLGFGALRVEGALDLRGRLGEREGEEGDLGQGLLKGVERGMARGGLGGEGGGRGSGGGCKGLELEWGGGEEEEGLKWVKCCDYRGGSMMMGWSSLCSESRHASLSPCTEKIRDRVTKDTLPLSSSSSSLHPLFPASPLYSHPSSSDQREWETCRAAIRPTLQLPQRTSL